MNKHTSNISYFYKRKYFFKKKNVWQKKNILEVKIGEMGVYGFRKLEGTFMFRKWRLMPE
jgi:hypothetical protein